MDTRKNFMGEAFEAAVLKSLDGHAPELARISKDIWENPEMGYQEFHAVKLLTEYLETCGYKVKRNFCNLETSFLGIYTTPGYNPDKHPTVAVLCEYDALPDIGHACGHNLIAIAGLGTFLAVCDALKSSGIEGRMLCMGTPAEEMGGGKVVLVESGAFKGVHFALMAHPSPINLLEPDILGVEHFKAEFFGRAAHASCGPWEGVNALDAVVASYNNISMLRQQLQPGHQVHMIISNGGAKPNIIPEHCVMKIYVRAPTTAEVARLRSRVTACLEAGAAATGCRLDCGLDDVSYSGLLSNKSMLSVYQHYGVKHGMIFPDIRPGHTGSTDMGNVSTVVPSIHPIFSVEEDEKFPPTATMIHTREFQVSAGRPYASKNACRAAMAMAMTSLELFVNDEFRKKVQHEFRGGRSSFMGASEDIIDGSLSATAIGYKGERRSSRAILVEAGVLPRKSLVPDADDSLLE